MHDVPAPVVDGVVQDDIGERDVADHGVETCLRQAGVGERLGTRVPGNRAAAIAAEIGSSSIPVTTAAAGAAPMNTPAPQPGSRTCPASNPNSTRACHMAAAYAGAVKWALMALRRAAA